MRGRAGSDDEDFYAHENQRLLQHEEDNTLHDLGSTVLRVHNMARQVNDEIHTQNHLIDEVDDMVDKTDIKMSSLRAKLKRLASDNTNRGKYCVILALLVLLWVLVGMVLE